MAVPRTLAKAVQRTGAPSRRYFHRAATLSYPTPASAPGGTNPALSFPCVDQNEVREQRIRQQRLSPNAVPPTPTAFDQPDGSPSSSSSSNPEAGPEPAYSKIVTGYETYHHPDPFELDYGGTLPSFDIAYETWGELNSDASNAVLLFTGLSASSHAKSHPKNPAEGWWEKFIGPGKAVDTDKYFVICTNVLGGCYGSTGPSSLDPSDGKPYATRFPILSIFDMVRAQFKLLDHLGIGKLAVSLGSSMGGMQSIAAAHLEPERVDKVVSISGTARSSPGSVSLRYAQRSVLMSDPNWNRGFYYDSTPPHTGMKLARQIATITYRSGPEWEQRFGRRRRPNPSLASLAPPFTQGSSAASTDSTFSSSNPPVLCPDFLIETYLDHQGEQFCLKYDANSLLYVSKAMDLFDMSYEALEELEEGRRRRKSGLSPSSPSISCPTPPSTSTSTPTTGPPQDLPSTPSPARQPRPHISSLPSSHAPYLPSLTRGLQNLARHPTLVMGAQSDYLFPIDQQRELAEALRLNGNEDVIYYELATPFGHDSFLIDVQNVGRAIKGFLS